MLSILLMVMKSDFYIWGLFGVVLLVLYLEIDAWVYAFRKWLNRKNKD